MFSQVLISSSNDLIYGTVSDRRDGTYIGLLTAVTVGKYELSALLGTDTILQSAPILVVAGYPSSLQTVLNSPVPARILSGADIYLVFQFRDQYSNIISDCANISVFILISNSTVLISNQTVDDCDSGLINKSISIRKSDSYQITPQWKIMDLFGSVLGAPFSTTVVSASADPAQCTAESRFLKIGQQGPTEASTVGITRYMTITAYDTWGNRVQTDPFSVIESFSVFLAATGQRCSPACPSTCDMTTGLAATKSDVCVTAKITNNYDSTYTACLLYTSPSPRD